MDTYCLSFLVRGDPTAGSPYGYLVTTSPPVMNHTVVNALPKVKLSTSGTTHSHGVTGGVYKARGTYSPQHSDFAITSDSDFMESSCRLQSGLRRTL